MMVRLTPQNAAHAAQRLADTADGPGLRSMTRLYLEHALNDVWEGRPTLALTALYIAGIARHALRVAENEGIIARLPDTLTPSDIENIDI